MHLHFFFIFYKKCKCNALTAFCTLAFIFCKKNVCLSLGKPPLFLEIALDSHYTGVHLLVHLIHFYKPSLCKQSEKVMASHYTDCGRGGFGGGLPTHLFMYFTLLPLVDTLHLHFFFIKNEGVGKPFLCTFLVNRSQKCKYNLNQQSSPGTKYT